jgi:hypothetical protein
MKKPSGLPEGSLRAVEKCGDQPPGAIRDLPIRRRSMSAIRRLTRATSATYAARTAMVKVHGRSVCDVHFGAGS